MNKNKLVLTLFVALLMLTIDGCGGGLEVKYAVTNVSYEYSTANPTIIAYVDFDILPAVSQVSVSLVAGGMLTDRCTLTAGGTHAHCAVNVLYSSANTLRVKASE